MAAVTRLAACATASCSAPRSGAQQSRAQKSVVLATPFKQGGAMSASTFMGQGIKMNARLTAGPRGNRDVTTCAAKVVAIVKLALDAGKANPAPPVGPALGSKGVNIMAFCKEYNSRTQDKIGTVIPVEITVYDDRSFTFVLKTPPASELIKTAAKIQKGAGDKSKGQIVGKITTAQLRDIAQTKLPDLNANDIDAAMKIVAGTARNMGVQVVDA